MSLPCVLVFAGLDPSGGAGLLADAEAIRASGARPLCVATALTVQTTRRARSFATVAAGLVEASGRALLEEEPVAAVKLGMLGGAEVVRAILHLLADRPDLPLVLDPVLASSSGAPLFEGGADAAREALLPLWPRALVTPNLPEARALLGRAPAPGPDEAAALALALLARGARAVLLKGGHGSGPESIDLLAQRTGPGAALCPIAGPRLPFTLRGTGCRLASALAAGLALGHGVEPAARAAKRLVADYLRAGQAAAAAAGR